MSHPQDLAVDNSEVSSGFVPAQREENPVTGCSQLSPSLPPQHSAYLLCAPRHVGREQALSSSHSSTGSRDHPTPCTLYTG